MSHVSESSSRNWPRAARRILIAVAGSLVLSAGMAMVVLPGPAMLVIPAGLAILATEFPWARRLLDRAKPVVGRVLERLRIKRPARRPRSRPPSSPRSSA
ncbi:MAG: PGPGW domain-containing protein [Myxococcaceae bacterium]